MPEGKSKYENALFNGAIEIGLRALVVLDEAYPTPYSLQRLVIFDYFMVHSDDIPDGPPGLHPKTPHRSGELLVRRESLQQGLCFYQSHGLIEHMFEIDGLFYMASNNSSSFLDVLTSNYVLQLRERARWVVKQFGSMGLGQLQEFANDNLGKWGAEFELQSVLLGDDRL